MSHENELEVQRALGRIEGTLTEIQSTQTQFLEGLKGHSRRLQSLERWRSWSTGVYVGVSILLVALWRVLHGGY